MKAIDGKLPVNQKYNLMSVDYVGDNYTPCENCGLAINTLATLKANDREYIVGTDCAEGLLGCSYSTEWQLKQASKKANQIKRYLAKLKKADREGLLEIKGEWYYIIDTKGIWSIRILETQKCVELFKQYKQL